MTARFSDLSGRNALIIGGLGFIGSNLARRLVDLGAYVTLIDSMNPLYGGNMHNIVDIKDKVTVNISDVRDRYSLPWLVTGKDFIFNLAGQTSHMDSMTDPFTDLEINAKSQLSLLEVCRAYCPETKIVFASTRQIYGRPQYLPVDERHPIKPVDVNGINKAAGEFYHILYSEVYGLRTTVLRLTNTYGPRMRVKDARQTFLGIWFRKLLEGQSFEVWGGDQKRDYTYIDDLVDALLISTLDPACDGKTYNIGGSEILSLRETAEMVIGNRPGATYETRVYPEDRKKIDIGDYYSDYRLFETATGWSPKVGFVEGSKRTLDYYRDNLSYYL
ncbi:NAD-dependent epimerase [Rhodospirillum rubrum]|uniref:NAD-dependent epimerase/dehydratase family protein n=1 Tax=Rhodospirillum rubrum TaxID=1085 RepID=UPI001908864A|nr:NAD-dependent epimerase/dehydratase family protein [Rhodospirillum rubrum]MBK1665773.1 NAD-dependent epimerase [Rhodospirillum rubrum]MBK1677856.1 NAD-dependent epimerase [Rhodospirillum rubrum]